MESEFRRGGGGRILVGETGLKVQLLPQNMVDIAALAGMGKTRKTSPTPSMAGI
jgi:hypothetical protein